MLALAFVLAVIYAVINALGAWAVIRRKASLAGLFMLAACFLVVAATAMVTALPFARVLLAAGLVLASLASLLYGRMLLGRINWFNQLLRLLAAAAIFLVAHLGLP